MSNDPLQEPQPLTHDHLAKLCAAGLREIARRVENHEVTHHRIRAFVDDSFRVTVDDNPGAYGQYQVMVEIPDALVADAND